MNMGKRPQFWQNEEYALQTALPTERPTDRRTHPHIEMLGRIEKPLWLYFICLDFLTESMCLEETITIAVNDTAMYTNKSIVPVLP